MEPEPAGTMYLPGGRIVQNWQDPNADVITRHDTDGKTGAIVRLN
jgi:hypothetical protein